MASNSEVLGNIRLQQFQDGFKFNGAIWGVYQFVAKSAGRAPGHVPYRFVAPGHQFAVPAPGLGKRLLTLQCVCEAFV